MTVAGAPPNVRVYAYRHRDEPYEVVQEDVSPVPFTIETGHGLTIMVRADTTVGPKWVALRIEDDAPSQERIASWPKRLAYPMVHAELPPPSTVAARRAQYMEVIAPRLAEAIAAA